MDKIYFIRFKKTQENYGKKLKISEKAEYSLDKMKKIYKKQRKND